MNKLFTKLKSASKIFAAVVLVLAHVAVPVHADSNDLIKNQPAKTVNGVTVEKTATPVAGKVNTFDVTLRVTAVANISSVTADTVLVIDTSGSMRGTKLTHAIEAAQSLASQLVEAGSRVAIVSYASQPHTVINFSTDTDALQSAIGGLSADGGTHTQGGLHQAITLLNSSTASFKNIVLLSDGEPTYSYEITDANSSYITNGQTNASIAQSSFDYSERVGNGSQMVSECYWRYFGFCAAEYNHGNSAIAEAGFFKDATNHKYIYTVALDAGTNGTNVLNNIASPGKAASTDDSGALSGIFDGIGESIANSINSASVNDPMAPGITFEGTLGEGLAFSEGTLSWVPNFVYDSATQTYVATYTYRIELNDDILNRTDADADGFFTTNGTTTLTTDSGLVTFNVPSVKPVTIDITKTLVGQEAKGQTFTATVAGPNGYNKTVTMTAGGTAKVVPTELGSYTVTETATANNEVALENYDITYTNNTFTITEGETVSKTVGITNTLETTTINVTKEWDDNDNQDGIRPDSVTAKLLNGQTETGKTVVLTEDGEWTGTFTNVPAKSNGEPITTYTVSEVGISGYEPEVTGSQADGFVITNSHAPEQTTINFSKVWDDNDNQDGARTTATVTLCIKEGEDCNDTDQTVDITTEDGDYSFTADKYANGQAISYGVKESAVEGYTTEITGSQAAGYTITNSHTPSTISISGTKTWSDSNNQDGVRPACVTIRLTKDNSSTSTTASACAASGWTYSFDNLPEYSAGEKINYGVTEDAFDVAHGSNYTPAITATENGFNIENSRPTETVNITINKSWSDFNNQDGLRADLTFKVVGYDAEGNEIEGTTRQSLLTLGLSFVEFNGLQKYYNGTEIVYKAFEVTALSGYSNDVPEDGMSITDNAATITNSHTPSTISISGTKTWSDSNNQDGVRPACVTIRLTKDNSSTSTTASACAASGWTYSFDNLPEYSAGEKINYGVTEDAFDVAHGSNYTPAITATENGFNIENSRPTETTTINFSKVWDDNDNQDGARAAATVTLCIKEGEDCNDTNQTVDITTEDGDYSFTADKYANGQAISYGVKESTVEGYTTEITGSQTAGYTITNSHAPEQTTINFSKVWDDNDNQDGARAAATVTLCIKEGEDCNDTDQTVEITTEDGDYSFTADKYADGVELSYGIKESEVEGYDTEITGSQADGYTITNSHEPEQVTINFNKVWDDNGNQDGLRTAAVATICIKNGNECTDTDTTVDIRTEDANYAVLMSKYADGVELAYGVKESTVEGYTTEITGSQADGYTITNSHTPEQTTINFSKVWDDNDNQDGARAAATVTLCIKEGEDCNDTDQTVDITTEDGDYSFTADKYADGVEISYGIKESEVEGYTTEITGSQADGYTITNSHEPEQVTINFSKVWDDNDNQDGARAAATVTLCIKEGEDCNDTDQTVDITTEDGDYSFTADKYADGVELSYGIKESEVEGYTTEITGSQAGGYTITNSHTPDTVDITVNKTWDDANNQDGLRVEIIFKVIGYDDEGNEVAGPRQATLELGKTFVLFEGLPKNHKGSKIIYKAFEVTSIAGYTNDASEGMVISDNYDATITNSHEPEQVTINFSKVWDDNDNQDGARAAATVTLCIKEGEDCNDTDQTVEITTEDGDYSFTADKYADGVELSYGIKESEVEGYDTEITGSQADGFVITNSHEPEQIVITFSKVWDDADDQDGLRQTTIVTLCINENERCSATDMEVIISTEDAEYEFGAVDKYANGKEISYGLLETELEGYEAEITGSQADGFIITNKHTPAPRTPETGVATNSQSTATDQPLIAIVICSILFAGLYVSSKKRETADNR